MFRKGWITVLALLLSALCLSCGCAESGENPLKEASEALSAAATAEEQLAILYDVSVRCAVELETGGWSTSLTCNPAEGLPEDLYYKEDMLESMERGDLTMEDLADAKIVCLYNDDKSIRLLGDFQVRIPEKNRAAGFEEADTVVYLLHHFRGRSDYIGSAYDRYYTVYVFRRGENTCRIACQKRTTPPASGRGTLTGEKLPLSEIWEAARPFFYGTMEVSCPEGKAVYRVTGSSCCLAALDGEFVRYEIPESVEGYPVTGIEAVRCETLEELVLPEGIVWIGDITCCSLRSINFPSTLRRITGTLTLDNVEHVILNEGLEELGDRAFYSARGADFTLPSTLKSLGKRNLANGVECPYLIIPEGVTYIPDDFLGDSPLLVSIYIPSGVQKIDGTLNYGRSRIYTPEGSAAARWARERGYRWTACETAADMPVPYYGEENGFVYAVMGDETALMRYAGVDEYVRIPETLGGYPVTVIRAEAFSRNNYIRSVAIPETVQQAQDPFIHYCRNVEAIYIPDTDADLSLGSYMMQYYVSSECCVYVPEGSARAQKWAGFEDFWLRWDIWTPGMEQPPAEEPFAWTAEQQEALRTPGASVTFGIRPPEEGEEGGPEPVEWTVLACEEGRSLLITRKGLYQARFSDADNGPTYMDWMDSSLRGKLQRDWFDAMFTYAERCVILPAEHDGMPEKIFLLSAEEAEQYFPADEDRICTMVQEGEEQPVQWWLRSKGSGESNYLAYVWKNGMIDTSGGTYRNIFAVRPALWVKTE